MDIRTLLWALLVVAFWPVVFIALSESGVIDWVFSALGMASWSFLEIGIVAFGGLMVLSGIGLAYNLLLVLMHHLDRDRT